MKIAHLTTVDLSLRYLLLPQLEAALAMGESIGISAPGEFVPELEERGIRHIALISSTRGMNLRADLGAMRQLWSILRSERPHVLHTHNPKPGLYGRVLGRLAGVPVVVNTVHGLYATKESPLANRILVYGLEGFASRFADAELIQNPEDLETLRRLKLVSRGKLRLLGNGVDLERFSPERAVALREPARRELGLGPEEIAVGMVGRLVAEKGVPELIEAARLLGDVARVFIAGPHDREKVDALSDDAIEAGRAAGVQFLGMREDVESFYAALDVFVLPSHREGFPRAAMEAAASGLPLVLTDIRGCRQVAEPGSNGLLVPVGDALQLANAIRTLCDDSTLRARMGAESARRAQREFDEDRVVRTVMTTYYELARRKGLPWLAPEAVTEARLRSATTDDAMAIARLHIEMITKGFLSTLGPRFLKVLYSALIESEYGRVLVVDAQQTVLGFIAGATDTSRFYKEFSRRYRWTALRTLLPALARPRTWKRIWETLRYGTGESEVRAELLSMAVTPAAQGLGWGRRLVEALLEEVHGEGHLQMKVIVGADNTVARALYEKSGFVGATRFEVHSGTPSLELTWRP